VYAYVLRRLLMKRAGIVLAAGLLLLTSLPLWAQQAGAAGTAAAGAATNTSGNPKDAYYKIVPLLKVWMHQQGYMVQFFNSKSQVSNVYIPLTWFNQGTNSKADIVYDNVPGIPYMTIFWVDGKFDHVRLYASSDNNSLTWGVLSQATDFTAQFNVQEIPREF
jgi:hypothetical protein